MKIRCKLEPGAEPPVYARPGDSGADLKACHSAVLGKGARKRIHTGVALELPDGWGARVMPRSGLSAKGIDVQVGTIDCGYRGSICVTIQNNSQQSYNIARGDRIAQLVLERVQQAEFVGADELSETERGEGGFGSTGK